MWGSCLRPGQAVALAAGSNTAVDQPALAMIEAHRQHRLDPDTGFPGNFVRLAKKDRVNEALVDLTPEGHYRNAHGDLPFQDGDKSQDFRPYKASLLREAR
eukprot:7058659-Pyramimonas_sp.AAC.1